MKVFSHLGTLLCSFILFFLLGVSCGSSRSIEFEEPEVFSKERIWLESLCSESFKGRRVGTLGNKRAFNYLLFEVQKMGINPEVQLFVHTSGDTLRNILAFIPGEVDSCIVIGSHFDGANESTLMNHYPAANDNASGVVTNLLIVDSLSKYSLLHMPHYSFCCAFWDGEETYDNTAFKGSKHFVSSGVMNGSIALYINLDTVGYSFSNNRTWLGYFNCASFDDEIRRLVYSLSSQHNLTLRDTQWNAASDDAVFLSQGVPTVSITDHSNYEVKYPLHSTKDTPKMVSLDRLVHISNSILYAFVR